MSLYLGDKKIVALTPNFRPWLGIMKNPQLLYTLNYECPLSDTNYPTKTPSSSQQSVTFPATVYSASAAANVIVDRWGKDYHGGEPLDFMNYEYYVLADYLIDVKYTVDEATIALTHAVKYTQTSIMPVYRNYIISNNVVTEGPSGTNTLTVTYYGTSRLWYRNASNVLNSASTTYGFYLTPVTFALSSTNITAPINFISFRTPTLYFRSNNSYHNLNAFDDLDIDNTMFKMRQKLYKAERTENYYEVLNNRQAYIFNNNDFPVGTY